MTKAICYICQNLRAKMMNLSKFKLTYGEVVTYICEVHLAEYLHPDTFKNPCVLEVLEPGRVT